MRLLDNTVTGNQHGQITPLVTTIIKIGVKPSRAKIYSVCGSTRTILQRRAGEHAGYGEPDPGTPLDALEELELHYGEQAVPGAVLNILRPANDPAAALQRLRGRCQALYKAEQEYSQRHEG
eukprot:g18790.t1